MDLNVRDKAYVIVGGTAGMGLAGAKVLAADGAAVAVIGRDEVRAKSAIDAVTEAGASAVYSVTADVSQPGVAVDAVTEAVKLLGRLDGIAVTMGTAGMMAIDSSDDAWDAAFRDVLLATTRSVQAAIPHLVKTRGAVVTTSAYSSRAPHEPRLPYASLKAAVATFTRGIARTYGKDGVRANSIAPGAVETDALHAIRGYIAENKGYPYDEALERALVEDFGFDAALARPGQPDEIGALIAFLLSDRCGFVTGQTIYADGGAP
ncbi:MULTISPECIES: SDR family NAD(P)-dependent oxidoreductase [Mycolicibacterium]|uniref:SDR family oxidoreductase n=5 Tax=Mycolicibacterium TaxID=1866885 RepID=A0AAE4VIJ5_MYCFO|nr:MULTISPECIES: SDR family oxidoreductase [Mycolicibacterium]MCV7142403.1 SDR family oxidoreductase [Mycolicibacterium fortuitum]MDV7194549.1 SDR family oxidoreductase [Mycolicibacterium fortuitum]MDV7208111.1 SDR family oxidoreductase [Mycolicibacterium fortuitum]MDV7230005.1 SDR family oxidoreductase [Mycolicibacterium fortuitum]MDV7261810.1 SDR family oxidoreductase [Mycolicibacterium fortuitum]